ncbi:MAG: DegT/DnrJ/EryC1/StrS family aminotransferase [Vicinamibacterales bacterium]
MGHVAAFSLGKNLGACGEAGAITADDARIAQQCRMLRKHGQSKKYYHDMVGYDGRLDAIGDFPVAEQVAAEILSLPMFPGLSAETQRGVVAATSRSSRRAGAGRVWPEPFEPNDPALEHITTEAISQKSRNHMSTWLIPWAT